MAKAVIQTSETGASVDEFLNSVSDEQQRADSREVIEMMRRSTGEAPKMWGPAIIGFGSVTVKYASGREIDCPVSAFSPRKTALTLYVLDGAPGEDERLARLGKHKTGKCCLYIKRLSDVDEGVLAEMIDAAVKHARH